MHSPLSDPPSQLPRNIEQVPYRNHFDQCFRMFLYCCCVVCFPRSKITTTEPLLNWCNTWLNAQGTPQKVGRGATALQEVWRFQEIMEGQAPRCPTEPDPEFRGSLAPTPARNIRSVRSAHPFHGWSYFQGRSLRCWAISTLRWLNPGKASV